MSFFISKVEVSPLLGNEANEYLTENFVRVVLGEKHLSKLPLPLKDRKLKPFYGHTDLCVPFLEAIIDFDIHSSDVFVCSLAKCGSSWMQIIVWLLTHGLDYGTVQSMDRLKRLGDFDEISRATAAKEKAHKMLLNDKSKSLDENAALKMAWDESFKSLDAPRVIKTHFPAQFLPKNIWSKGAKVIYMVRNPKDMLVSYYYFVRNFFHINFPMDDIVTAATNDIGFHSPYLDHILDFWKLKHFPNVLFVAYEDLVTDAFATIKKISGFLECKYTDEQLKKLTEYISFDNMKKNKAVNREEDVIRMENLHAKKRFDNEYTFLRKGKVGGYLDELSNEQIKKLDDWAEKTLNGTDLKFEI